MGRLNGKTALITGCSRGIGKAIVEKFAAEGADLICALRKENPDFNFFIQELSARYEISTRTVFFDLSDEDSIRVAFSLLQREKVPIHILVNNAGTPAGGLMLMTPLYKVKEVKF